MSSFQTGPAGWRRSRASSPALGSALSLALLASALLTPPAAAQAPIRELGELELSLLGVSATVDPAHPVVPKNTPSGVRIVVRAGAGELTAADAARFLGAGFGVEAELSGPGLRQTVTLPQRGPDEPLPADPLLLALPGLTVAGDYSLTNVRLVRGGRPVLDVLPRKVTVQVIDQILITSVKTRPLTLDEIKEKGIVLDSSSYLAFEFTLGLKLESKAVSFTFPVVFDRNGVAVPQPIVPPPPPPRASVNIPSPPLPTIVPFMLETGGGATDDKGNRIPLTLPTGEPVRIPSVLVIPGNVGYLKQHFSAQLFVANGAPLGSGLTVRDVTGTVKLPPGADGVPGNADDPLSLPETVKGPQPATLPVVGPEGQDAFAPGEQGSAEFLIRGEKEGFYTIDFDIAAVLQGLPVGPVNVTGKASGGVLVRNPFFDMTFTLPSVVRKGERFKLFTTVTNIGEGLANDVQVSLDAAALSGATLLTDPTQRIDTLKPGDARVLAFEFRAERTGQAVASYLHFDTAGGGQATGTLNFTLGVGERGIALSPDTLVLPTAVDALREELVDAAMRVLGQAWSIANAPSGTLPRGVIRTSKTVVTQKALAVAEAGLRVSLGQPAADAVRDLAFDFYGGTPLDPGFDQLLRTTFAGRDLAWALGARLADPAVEAGGPLAYEHGLAEVAASGPDFVSFVVGSGTSAAPLAVTLGDGSGRHTATGTAADQIPLAEVPGAVLIPLGPPEAAPMLGLLTAPTASPYTLELKGLGTGTAEVAVTLPHGDGSFTRVFLSGLVVTDTYRARIVVDLARPDSLVLEEDADGNGSFETERPLSTESILPKGPRLLSATLIGPESLDGASPFGFQAALVFDRVVDATSAAVKGSYEIPSNAVQSARRQLSGRMVFLSLSQPEGPYIPTTVTASDIIDGRGSPGAAVTVPLGSRLLDKGAVVSGRVLSADGTPVTSAVVTYENNADTTCRFPSLAGFAAVPVDASGRYEFRYVRQDNCGGPFAMATQDPDTGALRHVSSSVRAAGEQIVLDIALLGRGSVTGVVRSLEKGPDGLGRPVPGASVVVLSVTDPQVGGSATTDGDGRYLVPGIVVGQVSVRAGKGAALGRAAGRIDRAGTTAAVDVTLDAGSSAVSGTVRKLEGGVYSVVPGLMVVYKFLPEGSPYWLPMGVGETAPDGTFAFVGMPAGSFRLEAALNTRDQGATTGFAAPGFELRDKDIVIEVRSDRDPTFGSVKGKVLLPEGGPGAGVVVTVGSRGVLSDGSGGYEIPGVEVKPGQSQTVSAQSRDGLRSGQNSFLLNEPGQVVDNVDITLSRIGTLRFTVLDPAGNPLEGVPVSVLTGCQDPCGCATQKTNAAGYVELAGFPASGATAQATREANGSYEAVRGSAAVPPGASFGSTVLRFKGIGIVSGIVLDPDGKTSFGADVTLSSQHFVNDPTQFLCGMVGGVSHRARTGTDGSFRFTGVGVGSVSATASQPFFPTPVGQQGTLTADGQELRFQLKLVSTIAGVLSGTVFLPDGQTPAGAGVTVTANGALPDVAVSTDAQGHYRFAKIFPQGHYTLTVRDPVTGGVALDHVFLSVGQDMARDIRLKGRGTVRVTVVDGSNQPVGEASVRLQETDFPSRSYEGAVEPANQGVAVFENVYEGPFSVDVSDVHARGGRASSVLPGAGATVDVKVRLTVTGTVKGRFLMPDGTPIPFGTVRLSAGGRTIGQVTTAGAGDVGAYSFDYVPVGSVRLDAQDPLTGRTGFAVGALEGDLLALDVKAQGLGTVHGLVTSNGAPQPAAHVDLVSGDFRASTLADASGNYLVSGVPEGRVVVTASISNGFLAGTASATLTGDGADLRIDVALRDSGTVTGQVLKAGGGAAGPPSVVSIQVGGTGGGTFTTSTDETGHFRFDRIPAGHATLAVDVLGSIDLARATAEVPAADTVDVPIVLNGVGAIQGTAFDNEGKPTAGRVSVSGSGPFPYALGLDVGSSGQFELPEVLAGPFTATLSVTKAPGVVLYGRAAGTVDPDGTAPLQIRLQDSGTVTGTVLRSDQTTPAYGAEVTIRLQSNATVKVQAGDNGVFTTAGLLLGAINVSVFDPVTTGRAVVRGRSLDENGQVVDLGTIVLDDRAPVLTFVQPAAGSTRAAFGGPLVLDLADQGTGVDFSTFRVSYPLGGYVQGASSFTFVDGRVTGGLFGDRLLIGPNTLRASVADVAGNTGEAEVVFTVTGGSIRGTVAKPGGGGPAIGVPVQVDALPVQQTDGTGGFLQTGLRPGAHSVMATDPDTGLARIVSVDLPDGEETQVAITLPDFARIAGVVRHPDRSAAGGVKVTANGGRSATTDGAGSFQLGPLPLGTYTLEAENSANGDHGRTVVVLTQLGVTAPAEITLNGVGSANVTVVDAGGVAVANAPVTLTSSSPFAVPQTATTGPAGQPAQFPQVLAGVLTASAMHPVTNLHGQETGVVADRGSVSITVKLESAGRVVGTVFRRTVTGTVPAGGGLSVQLGGPSTGTTSTDANGAFAFENVRLGDFQLSATAGDGDRGRASGTVAANGQTAAADITLNGLGTVTVTVRSASGDAVKADVTVDSGSPFGGHYAGTTDDQGSIGFSGVLAGPITATASSAVSPTPVQASGTLDAGGALPLFITLKPTGTITGHVFQPNGGGAVNGAVVWCAGRSVTTGSGGSFEFTNLAFGTYGLQAYVNGHLRAQVTNVVVSEETPLVQRDLTLVGVGTAVVLVSDPAGSPADKAFVSLSSPGPFGGGFQCTTGTAGRCQFDGLPVGSFTVSASRSSLGQSAEGSGSIPADGATVTVPLRLLASTVQLPFALNDGNGFDWHVQESGGLQRYSMLDGNTPRLSLVVADGPPQPFAGSGRLVATEEGKREIVLVQGGLAGLDVTRKVFVAVDGYFVRYLDILRNPGSAPVTVDVVEESQLPSSYVVLQTSSGDPDLGPADHWVALSDARFPDVFAPGVSPYQANAPVAFVTSGPAGAGPDVFQVVADQKATVTETWKSIPVAPGGMVAFLHVLSAETDTARAVNAATRLVQLPPELLAGMATEEAAAIRNFAVPASLQSSLTPLPLNDGVVTVNVLAGDGETPVADVLNVQGNGISLRSRSPYYGRPLTAGWNAAAPTNAFTFRGGVAGGLLLPRDPFDVSATAANFSGPSGPVFQTTMLSGDFPSSGLIDLANVPGRILRASSSSAGAGPEQATDSDLTTTWRTASGDAANQGRAPFLEIVLPGDGIIHQVRVRGQRGSDTNSIRRARIEVRDAAGVDDAARPALWSAEVDLPAPNRDADLDVPAVAGARSVRLTSLVDASATPGLAELQVIGEASLGPTSHVDVDAVFAGTGVVMGDVLRSDQTPFGGASVRVSCGALRRDTKAAADGSFSVVLVPPGSCTVTATHPLGSPSVTGPEMVIPGGDDVSPAKRVSQDLVFAAFGSVKGFLRSAIGTAVGGWVQVDGPGVSRGVASSAATGYSVVDLPEGTYTLTARDDRTSVWVARSVGVAAGAATTLDVQFVPVGTVVATVTVGSAGTPALYGWFVSLASDARSGLPYSGYTDANGRATIANVPAGPFRVHVAYPGQPASFAEATGTLTTELETVPVAVNVPGVGTAAGTLRSRDGVPYGGRYVYAFSGDGSKQFAIGAADGSGAFSIGNVPVGPILLRSDNGAGSPTLYAQAEVGGTIPQHGATVALDALVPRGTIAARGQRDVWETTANAEETIQVEMAGTTHPLAPLGTPAAAAVADPYLELYGPDGALVASNDNISPSNHNALVSLTATATGTYVLVARAAGAQTGGYQLGSPSYLDARVWRIRPVPVVQGHVRRDADGQAVPGRTVRLVRGAATLQTTVTDGNGSYSLVVFPAGAYAVETVDGEGVVLARAEGDASTPAVITQDLVEPVHGTVRVTVRRLALAMPGIAVSLASDHPTALPADRSRTRTTDGSGVVTASLPVGTITATAVDPRSGTHTVSDTLTESTPLDLAIVFPDTLTRFTGHVRARDGLTGVPNAPVWISRPGFGVVASTVTDASGLYRLAPVQSGSYTLSASYGSASRSLEVTAEIDGEVQVDLGLDLSVLRGRVREADGMPLVGAQVTACGYSYRFNGQYCISTSTEATGEYAFYGLPDWYVYYAPFDLYRIYFSGPVTVTAAAPDNEQATVSSQFIYDASTTATEAVDLAFPPAGSVKGRVLVGGGASVVSGATVSVLAPDGTAIRSQATDAQGQFLFTRAAVGEVRLYAEDPQDRIPGEARGTVAQGQELTLDVTLSPAATLEVSLWDETGQERLERQVSVAALDAPRRSTTNLIPWSRTFTTSATAPVTIRVPAGLFRAVFEGDADVNGRQVGQAAAEGLAAEGTDPAVTLTRGSHTTTRHALNGTNGSYCLGGSCDDGGVTVFATTATEGGALEPDPDVVSPEMGGRSYRTLQVKGQSVLLRRQHFVPDSGSFGRTLTSLTNPTDAPVTVTLDSSLVLGNCETWRVVATSSGDTNFNQADGYVVLESGSGGQIAIVTGTGVPPSAVDVRTEPGECDTTFVTTQHQVEVPPHATRAFLTFTAAPATGDATLLAQDLLALKDPALFGLTDEERASIANFSLAVPGRPGVTGSVTDGGVGVAGAPVGAVRNGVVVAQTATDAAGAFQLPWLSPGDYSLVAFEPTGRRPGRLSVTLGSGQSLDVGPIALLPAGQTGTVAVDVFDSSGAVAGRTVEVTIPGYGPFWRLTAVTDANGHATFDGVPAGFVSTSAGGGLLPAGGELRLRSRTGPGTVRAIGIVQDPSGAAVAGARVGAMDNSGATVAETSAGADGSFALDGLVLYDGYRLVVFDPATNRPGSTSFGASVDCAPSCPPLDLGPVALLDDGALGNVHVHATLEGSSAPAAGAEVVLEANGYSPFWTARATLDAGGDGTLPLVPAGYVTVTSGAPPDLGWEDGNVVGTETLEMTLRIGSRSRLPYGLAGADGFSYFALDAGNAAGSANGSCISFCGTFASADGSPYPGRRVALVSQAGREVVNGTRTLSGLTVTRRAFVPAGGGFLRLLDVIENKTAAPITTTYDLVLSLGSTAEPWSVVTTSNGDAAFTFDDDYAVTSSTDPTLPEMALVVSGPGAAARHDAFEWNTGDPSFPWYRTRWPTLTVAPGQTVILMQFVAQRPHGDTAAATAQAEALASLSDPEALAGLTDSEKAAIVNFKVTP